MIAFGAELAVLSSLGNAGSGLSGETKVLMGGKTMFEYDTTTGLTRPAFPSVPPARSIYSYIAYSSGYLCPIAPSSFPTTTPTRSTIAARQGSARRPVFPSLGR